MDPKLVKIDHFLVPQDFNKHNAILPTTPKMNWGKVAFGLVHSGLT